MFGLGELFKFFPWWHYIVNLSGYTVVGCRRFLGLRDYLYRDRKVPQVARAFIDYPPYVDQRSSSVVTSGFASDIVYFYILGEER